MDTLTEITSPANDRRGSATPRLDLDREWPSVIDAPTCKDLLGFALDPGMHQLLGRHLALPLRELIDRGGKRWRMILGGLAHRACGGTRALTDPAFGSVELLHTASLVVDDIQDDSDERRGGPAAHVRFGIPTALGAANTAYFRSLALLAHLPDHQRLRAYDVFIRELHAAHVGQAMDLVPDPEMRSLTPEVLRERYFAMAAAKSGALVRIAGALGAILADAPVAWEDALRTWGSRLGVAYQIVDDVEDSFEEDPTADERLCFPIVAASELGRSLPLDGRPGDSKIRDHCYAAARAEADRACDALLGLPESTHREALIRLTQALTQTEKS